MKKYLLFLTVLIVGMVTGFSFLSNSNESVYDALFQTRVEALTEEESSAGMKHCRCHDDHNCYDGYAISVRPVCAKGHYIRDCKGYPCP